MLDDIHVSELVGIAYEVADKKEKGLSGFTLVIDAGHPTDERLISESNLLRGLAKELTDSIIHQSQLLEVIEKFEELTKFTLRHTEPARARAVGYKATHEKIKHHPMAKKVVESEDDDGPDF